MNKLLVFLFSYCMSSISGLPNPQTSPVTVLKDERIPPGSDGSFSYKITLSDGTEIQQSGNPDVSSSGKSVVGTGSGPSEEAPALVIRGEYTYVDPQGMTHKVTYVADKNGFQPEGDDIPRVRTGSKNTILETKLPSNITQKKAEEPLNTISSSLFSSPSGTL